MARVDNDRVASRAVRTTGDANHTGDLADVEILRHNLVHNSSRQIIEPVRGRTGDSFGAEILLDVDPAVRCRSGDVVEHRDQIPEHLLALTAVAPVVRPDVLFTDNMRHPATDGHLFCVQVALVQVRFVTPVRNSWAVQSCALTHLIGANHVAPDRSRPQPVAGIPGTGS